MGGMKDLLGDEPYELRYPGDRALARSSDPATSHAAAASLVGALPQIERAVYDVIVGGARAGTTLDEIADLTGLDKVTASPRMKPLCEKGLIAIKVGADGKTLTRPGKSGRGQTIWFAKEFAK